MEEDGVMFGPVGGEFLGEIGIGADIRLGDGIGEVERRLLIVDSG